MTLLTALLTTLLTLSIPLILLRLSRTLRHARNKPIRHGRRNPREPTHLMLLLGSGGHTAELLSMLHKAVDPKLPPTFNSNDPKVIAEELAALRLDWRDYTHRTWVTGTGDEISKQRAGEFEDFVKGVESQGPSGLVAGKVKKATDAGPGSWDVRELPRAREIHQPAWSAPISCLRCFISSLRLLVSYMPAEGPGAPTEGSPNDAPDLILCNGPATAVMVVFAAVVLRFFNYRNCSARGKMRVVFVESWARVRKPSLSGHLLSRVVDRFLVQWPQLDGVGGTKAEFLGVLVE